MNLKPFLALFLLCLLPYLVYLVRPDITGADSYYFLSVVCHKAEPKTSLIPTAGNLPAVFTGLLSLVPCNIIAVKTLLFLFLFASTLIVAKIGNLFHEKGWIAGVLIFMSPAWITEFSKFEADQFAFPILFASQYFFIRGIKEKSTKFKAIGLSLVLLTGLIWNGSVLYLFGYAFYFWPALLLAAGASLVWGGLILSRVLPYPQIQENKFLYGIARWQLLFIGFFGLPAEFFPLAGYFGLLTVLSTRWVIHSLPLLAVGSMLLYHRFSFNKKYFLIGVTLFSAILASFYVFQQIPTPAQTEAVKFVVDYAQGNTIVNEWSTGRWIQYYGGNPTSRGGPPIDAVNLDHHIAFVNFPLECPLIKEFPDYNVYDCRKTS